MENNYICDKFSNDEFMDVEILEANANTLRI